MMDVGKSLRERNALALTNPITDFKPATLAGISGLGIIQVIRTAEGEVLEVIGTWRLEDGGSSNTDSLNRAYQNGESVSYQGHFSDPLHLVAAAKAVDVRIVAMRAYQYEAAETAEDKKASKGKTVTKTLYRLEPVQSS